MFRVVYEWKVPVEQQQAFQAIWRTTTETIHSTVEGALGSFMLRSSDDPEKILTVAKWHSRQHWQQFWGNCNPHQMQKMRAIAERISVETFDELEDRSK